MAPIASDVLKPGTPIYGYVKMQKGQGIWRPCSVINCDGAKVKVRAARREAKTLLALEDVRLRPEHAIARTLRDGELSIPPQQEEQQEAQTAELLISSSPLGLQPESEEEEEEADTPQLETGADQHSQGSLDDDHEVPSHQDSTMMKSDEIHRTEPSSGPTSQAPEIASPPQAEVPVESDTPEELKQMDQSESAETTALRRSGRRRNLPVRYRDMLTVA